MFPAQEYKEIKTHALIFMTRIKSYERVKRPWRDASSYDKQISLCCRSQENKGTISFYCVLLYKQQLNTSHKVKYVTAIPDFKCIRQICKKKQNKTEPLKPKHALNVKWTNKQTVL